MTKHASHRSPLQSLIVEDAVGQLRRRDGLMATLGSENGVVKLDWVEGIARLLADPTTLESLEAEAQDLRQRGIRHIIWSGMGGSVLAVRVLCDLGFCLGDDDPSTRAQAIAIHPLDSTDPAALNQIVRDIATVKGLPVPAQPSATPQGASPTQAQNTEEQKYLQSLLHDVMMIGVSMGMTSEEPITHLTWFIDLLHRAQLQPVEHLLVMTLPGSYLDMFAQQHDAPRCPLQFDGGTGTGGRMSAPTTRVFLLPAALFLTSHSAYQSGQLRSVLQNAWDDYNLELATSHPAEHPYVQLAAALSAASADGVCRLLLRMPEGWHALVPWIEQLMEESLGKGGKGVIVFDDQSLNRAAPDYRPGGLLQVHVVTDAMHAASDGAFILAHPSLTNNEPHKRLSALATSFLGWQLSMALYGYLHHIHFAGQPAVENYKTRAHALSSQPDPLQITADWHPAFHEGPLTFLAPSWTPWQRRAILNTNEQKPAPYTLAEAFTSALQGTRSAGAASKQPPGTPLGYLDMTINGEAGSRLLSFLHERLCAIGNTLLGIPVKLRQAPAAYHSTEQSEMDGPPCLISLRFVARNTEACILGTYTNAFLHAQAVSTWQAMMEVNRPCYLLVVDDTLDDACESLATFLSQVENELRGS